MFYATSQGPGSQGLSVDPFKALIVPRPIGWISTVSKAGTVNLAPYSFFNALAEDPPYVVFSSVGRKDTQRNAEETGEFVWSMATWDLREAMNVTSAHVGPEVDEMAMAGLAPASSRLVKPPRVAASPAAFECKTWRSIELPSRTGVPYTAVIGEVVGIHIDEAFLKDGRVDTAAMRPLARLGYSEYSVIDSVFRMRRPG